MENTIKILKNRAINHYRNSIFAKKAGENKKQEIASCTDPLSDYTKHQIVLAEHWDKRAAESYAKMEAILEAIYEITNTEQNLSSQWELQQEITNTGRKLALADYKKWEEEGTELEIGI